MFYTIIEKYIFNRVGTSVYRCRWPLLEIHSVPCLMLIVIVLGRKGQNPTKCQFIADSQTLGFKEVNPFFSQLLCGKIMSSKCYTQWL